MHRLIALFLSLVLIVSLTACGGSISQDGPSTAPAGDSPAASGAEEPEPEPAPEPEPYDITSPTVMPEGGSRDGVTYAAYDGVVEHLFFHPVVAYPELAFDGDNQANGIDDYMVTVDEYNKILQSVYDKG